MIELLLTLTALGVVLGFILGLINKNILSGIFGGALGEGRDSCAKILLSRDGMSFVDPATIARANTTAQLKPGLRR